MVDLRSAGPASDSERNMGGRDLQFSIGPIVVPAGWMGMPHQLRRCTLIPDTTGGRQRRNVRKIEGRPGAISCPGELLMEQGAAMVDLDVMLMQHWQQLMSSSASMSRFIDLAVDQLHAAAGILSLAAALTGEFCRAAGGRANCYLHLAGTRSRSCRPHATPCPQTSREVFFFTSTLHERHLFRGRVDTFFAASQHVYLAGRSWLICSARKLLLAIIVFDDDGRCMAGIYRRNIIVFR